MKAKFPDIFLKADKAAVAVWTASLIVMALLVLLTRGMNFWPTDAEAYYLPSAVQLPQFDYVSQMHTLFDTEKIKWLHGKEMFVIHTAVFQRLLDDYKTLRPLVLVCILSFGFSGILIFHLIRRYWGNMAGGICFLFFMTSVWPYVYILFVKHQPLGLFYFLWALYTLPYAGEKKMFYFFSAFLLSLSLFSSTVSILYVPFYLFALGHTLYKKYFEKLEIKEAVKKASLILVLSGFGFLIPLMYFNYPDIIGNIKGYLAYAAISRKYNHFFYNQPVLRQWVEHPELSLRGGWEWVVKYFFLIMPVLFPLFIAAVVYLACKCPCFFKKDRKSFWATVAVVVLGVLPPVLAEIQQVAQYGANYFASMAGILAVCGYAVFIFAGREDNQSRTPAAKKFFGILAGMVLVLNAAVSVRMFFGDLYPTRMMTTFLSEVLRRSGTQKIYTYTGHPSVNNVVGCLDPGLLENLQVVSIDNIYQADTDGLIVVPPVTGDSIYLDVTRNTYNDYDKDIYLNDLIRRNALADYAVASFGALPSSRLWLHEEEVLSYRALILGHLKAPDPQKTRVWVLDPARLWQDTGMNKPNADYARLIFNGIRNIGTKSRIYVYEGEQKEVERLTPLTSFVMRVFKTGNPADGLVAYIYTLADDEPVWIPFTQHFQSEILNARDIPSDPQGKAVKFRFSNKLLLVPGPYKIVIYRTGPADDQNYYSVYVSNPGLTSAYMKAADILMR